MLVLILISVLCCVYAISVRKKVRKGTEPPLLPNWLPLVGHIPLDFRLMDTTCLWKLIEEFSTKCKSAGGVATLLLGPKTLYVVTDPEDSVTVANNCLQKSRFYDFAKPWLGDGLISADVPTWKTHRRLLNPAFSQAVLDSFIEVFNDQARLLVNEMQGAVGTGPFNHWPYLAINGLDTICLTALGSDIGSSKNGGREYLKALGKMFNIIIARVAKVWYHSDWIYGWSGLKKDEKELIDVLHGMSNKVLKHRKQALEEKNNNVCPDSKTKFKPFLDLLLELADEEKGYIKENTQKLDSFKQVPERLLGNEKKAFTDAQIREHVDTMIVAGHDTSANTLMYALVLLGSHPECQKKVFEEITDVLGCNDDVTKYDLPRLVYTEAVIKETLRLYPIFPVLTRTVDRELRLKNYTLSPGKTCLILLYGIHRDTCWGPDAEQFKPERWLDPANLPGNPNAFAGFSIGRRGCIGKTYAMMSMKTTLAHLIRRYRIQADCSRLKLKLGVMLKPASGHHISIDRR